MLPKGVSCRGHEVSKLQLELRVLEVPGYRTDALYRYLSLPQWIWVLSKIAIFGSLDCLG